MLQLLLIPLVLLIYLFYKSYEYHPMITGGVGKKIHKSYFTKDKLKKYKDFLETLDNSYASLIIQNGKVIFKYGDISNNKIYIASMRKGVLGILYGMYDIDINKTLKELDIDDVEGLTEEEKTVTISDLLQVKSGIYHPASNGGDEPNKPQRGSKKPGTYWVYNNWDYNVLGTIFEQETGMNIHDAVKKLGDELGFEDYDKARVEKDKEVRKLHSEDKSRSIYPRYHLSLSARDLSKIGLLMLNKGKYKGKQIVPQKWIKKLTTLVTTTEEARRSDGFGYGHLWWVYDTNPDDILYGTLKLQGVGGSWMLVIPKLNVIIVVKRVKGLGPEYHRVVKSNEIFPLLFPTLFRQTGMMKEHRPKISYIKNEDSLVTYFNNIGDYKLNGSSEIRIGSITKLFTAIAIFIAQKQGKLKVEDLANDYLPVDIGPATIKDLINHTSGLRKEMFPDKCKKYDSQILNSYRSATDILNKLIMKDEEYSSSLKPINPVGKEFYSNIGYVLLGVILEKVTDMTWYEFIDKNIIIPLDLNHTGVGKTNIPAYLSKTLEPITEFDLSAIYTRVATGCLYSTIKDLNIFARNLHTLPFDIEEFITDAPAFWDKEKLILEKYGMVTGGRSHIKVQYTDNSFKEVKHICIVLINGFEEIKDCSNHVLNPEN